MRLLPSLPSLWQFRCRCPSGCPCPACPLACSARPSHRHVSKTVCRRFGRSVVLALRVYPELSARRAVARTPCPAGTAPAWRLVRDGSRIATYVASAPIRFGQRSQSGGTSNRHKPCAGIEPASPLRAARLTLLACVQPCASLRREPPPPATTCPSPAAQSRSQSSGPPVNSSEATPANP